MPATPNTYGEVDYLTAGAPLASVEDLSRVNTPGGSPSPRPRNKHPALEDPNWEPPEEQPPNRPPPPPPTTTSFSPEPTALTPLHPEEIELEDEEKGPDDRYCLVFLVLVLHGVGTLMPWNSVIITAKNYFVDFKLQNMDGSPSEYATNFLPYLGYAAQLPNLFFNWINIFLQSGENLTVRIVWTILIEVVIFMVTVILAMVDSTEWPPGAFFWVTMVTVIILNTANGIYQNTVYGMAARLPFKYTGAVVLGSNISGTLTAMINIAAIAVAPNIRTSAIYYFITALFILLACFDTYFALPMNRFYRFYESQYEKASRVSKRDPKKSRVPYWQIFKTAFPQLFNVFMVFFVTLAVFPAVLAAKCNSISIFFINYSHHPVTTCLLNFRFLWDVPVTGIQDGNVLWMPRRMMIFASSPTFLLPSLVLFQFLLYFHRTDIPSLVELLLQSCCVLFALLTIPLGLFLPYCRFPFAMLFCFFLFFSETILVKTLLSSANKLTGEITSSGLHPRCCCCWLIPLPSIPNLYPNLRYLTDRIT
ncbi:unnamed protein product, partial [Meganyctiphanes norvegica]